MPVWVRRTSVRGSWSTPLVLAKVMITVLSSTSSRGLASSGYGLEGVASTSGTSSTS